MHSLQIGVYSIACRVYSLHHTSLFRHSGQSFPMQYAILCGYYGMGNAGDEALLVSLLQALPAHLTPIVLSKTPQETLDRYGVEACDRWNLGQVFSAMRRSQVFIWGGGSLMQDSSSAVSPLYYGGLMKLAQILGLQTIAWAQGIGPLTRSHNQWLTRQVLQQCDLVTVRDEKSYQQVDRWKIPVTQAPDPIWSMVAKPGVDLSAFPGPRIAVNLRQHVSLTPDRLELLTQSLCQLQAQTQATVLLVPFQKSLDWDLAQMLQARISKSEIYWVENPEVLKGLFQQVDLTIAMRLHAVIMAASERCPCFALSYDPKVTRVMEAANLAGLDLKGLNMSHFEADCDGLVQTWSSLLHSSQLPEQSDIITAADRHTQLLRSTLPASSD